MALNGRNLRNVKFGIRQKKCAMKARMYDSKFLTLSRCWVIS